MVTVRAENMYTLLVLERAGPAFGFRLLLFGPGYGGGCKMWGERKMYRTTRPEHFLDPGLKNGHSWCFLLCTVGGFVYELNKLNF